MRAVEWENGKVRFIDQNRLPSETRYVVTDDPLEVAEAIRSLAIRGAPLIGIAAAYGVALGLRSLKETDLPGIQSHLEKLISLFASTRPTAVNLFWALERIRRTAAAHLGEPLSDLQAAIREEARAIHQEDERMGLQIGRHGADLLPNAAVVLTHCNTGWLATGGTGTALAVITQAWERHKLRHVYVGETRPLLQGARLTVWELKALGIPSTLVVDSAAAFLLALGRVNTIVVGADRIAANGDVANKVGTYALAVMARYHAIPFYVAAPTSSIDFGTPDGKSIPIEQRSPKEITELFGRQIAPDETNVYNPAFDITPSGLITAMITEKGVFKAPVSDSLKSFSGSPVLPVQIHA